MNSRSNRNRRNFRLESLEVRDAPAHFGGMAHAAVALKVHAPAHVAHINAPHISASHVSAKPHAVGNGSGTEQSAENGVGTNGNDHDNIQLNQNDQSGVDAAGQN